MALAFIEGGIYFGGSKDFSTGFVPIIGYANPTTLHVEDAWYLDDQNLKWMVELIYIS